MILLRLAQCLRIFCTGIRIIVCAEDAQQAVVELDAAGSADKKAAARKKSRRRARNADRTGDEGFAEHADQLTPAPASKDVSGKETPGKDKDKETDKVKTRCRAETRRLPAGACRKPFVRTCESNGDPALVDAGLHPSRDRSGE